MAVLCVAHFLVDLLCALLVTRIGGGATIPLLLVYNFCAFALEMPLGIVVEGSISPRKLGAVGILLVLDSWALVSIPLLALVVAGVGNALFHLGGGLWVMETSPRATPLGLFIAPGAVGIYLDAMGGPLWIGITFVLAFICVTILWKWSNIQKISVQKPAVKCAPLAVLSLVFVVILRGFSGSAQSFPWKSEFELWILVAVVLGKALGGYLSDRFGAYPVTIGSLSLATLCFCLPASPAFGLLGLFSFQLTMPITLWLLARMMPKGLAFGLLTFGLFLGSLPGLLGYAMPVPLATLVACSLLLFVVGTKRGIAL